MLVKFDENPVGTSSDMIFHLLQSEQVSGIERAGFLKFGTRVESVDNRKVSVIQSHRRFIITFRLEPDQSHSSFHVAIPF